MTVWIESFYYQFSLSINEKPLQPVQMDWVPITRDCTVFAVNVIVLIGIHQQKQFNKRNKLSKLISQERHGTDIFTGTKVSS